MTDVIVIRENGSRDVGLKCDEPSLTKQSESDACDINKIMARYEKDGVLRHVSENAPFYADVSQVPDYQAALEVVQKADELFMSMPAELRAKFDNDPQVYFDFVSNPANKAELEKLGLVNVPVVEAPVKVEVVNQPQTVSGA